MNTLNIIDQASKGRIRMVKPRKNSKFIEVFVFLDDYGFEVKIPLEQIKELIK